ncbi:MAG TPA: hypothetical protein DEF41_09755 [Desulfovibrio sp.]|uniref:Uncharacterized protein n=1 Tax=Nitratidesulfovibrio vulgaris (strain ATCC 29579 / DSM 644 / CCUG 34227 / NCIMB 8303 / VKM B-1760 / Hildenborough) TaxID=882 RepID=Q727B9_NITV2|nr:hypothetical protein DVU_2936 [Nitratidesulfovibrio vulgaris str. Hildenborough]HBW16396.1 hypothetical protein [Desulfovibrio sp.]
MALISDAMVLPVCRLWRRFVMPLQMRRNQYEAFPTQVNGSGCSPFVA